jgi:hypothetical protein
MRALALGLSMVLATGAAQAQVPGGPTQRPDSLRDVVLAPIPAPHDWPSAFRFDAGGVDVDLAPHAGVSRDNEAEAGAEIRLGQLGVRDADPSGQTGRWYLFAAASGRSVGLDMLQGEAGWSPAGWSTDPASALVSDAQAGVGWRRGATQASVGYIHRDYENRHLARPFAAKDHSLVAFSVSIKPAQ